MFKHSPQYDAGFDAAWNGPSIDNSSYRHFFSPEARDDWQRGYDAAKRKREALKANEPQTKQVQG